MTISFTLISGMKILFIAFAPLICNGQYTAATIAKIDSLFHTVFKSGEPGGAVLIAKEGKIIYQKGFGIADINTKEPITTKTLFNVGSISKTFVAYGILKLAAQEKLSLNDNLHKYFPDFKNREIAEKVKLYHLLTHSSGLPDSRKIKEDSVFYLTAKDEGSWDPIKLTEKLNFEPGERFEYSNPAFNGLALVIEKITGKKWQLYIEETIYKPSGMELSTITDGPHPDKGVSHGYLFDGKKFYEKDYGEEPTFPAAGNGGVWSSAEELWKYEQAIQGNIFLDSAWINKSRTVFPLPGWKDKAPSFMGLSWFITTFMNQGMIGHTGLQGGFISDYVWLPDKKLFYVLLCNTPKPIEEIRNRLLHIIQ
jgi:CubicO group peptidase (beta-lactamase class C family)